MVVKSELSPIQKIIATEKETDSSPHSGNLEDSQQRDA
jgi:hypothetical protein